ncbi:MAG: cytochrome c [Desulfobacterota bacterium]|nr:cytochrome c [Thermodesulfobacteriota bacterium]
MSRKAAKNFFIFGSLFFFLVLVVLTIDTLIQVPKRAPAITAEIDAGKKVWHKYDCIGCHTIMGNGSYFAPDMTTVAKRKPKDFLKKFILDPRAINPKAAMPKLGLTEKEADHLIALLEWTSQVDTNKWPPKPVLAAAVARVESTPGQLIYQKQNCAACHMIAGIGGTAGPDLTRVGPKWKAEPLTQYLKNPASVKAGSAMPSFAHLSEQELKELTDYLLTLQ